MLLDLTVTQTQEQAPSRELFQNDACKKYMFLFLLKTLYVQNVN